MKQQSSSIVTLALLLASGSTSLNASAQTAADNFPLPTSVAAGTKVQIDGSSSLQAVNQGLKERFQKQFPGTDVTVPSQYQGSDSGIKAVEEDKTDLAGIGRPLTKAEKAQGLASKTIGRAKIAIIVAQNNPYTGNLTLKDFAKIYRGEVTDWSQLPSAKGAKGKIRVIDRPDTSDTRRAFANYPVFQNGKLKTGSNAEKLTEDSTQSVVAKLGEDGIGYAPADQIKGIPGIRAVMLHGTQPDNLKYPFSQSLAYVYKNKGGQVREGAKAFLGYVSDPAGQAALKESIAVGAFTAATSTTPTPTASPNPTATGTTGTTGTAGTTGATGGDTTSTTTTTTTDAKKGGFPWLWWILPLVVAGGGLLWLLGRKKPAAAPDPVGSIVEKTGVKPLYPPPPSRTARGDGLSGDLSGDLSSSGLSGFRPSDDMRSGDLRSGDLSGTIPQFPNPGTPDLNLNSVVDSGKDQAGGIGLAGGAAIAGGAAAAAAMGKGIFDRANQPSIELDPPTLNPPDINIPTPLEGLKDEATNVIPNLDSHNPLEGIQDQASGFIQDRTDSSDLSLETGDLHLPLENIQAKAADLIPDVQPNNPLAGMTDRVGDFLQDGGGTVAAAGGAALAGGAGNTVSNFFGSEEEEDISTGFATGEIIDGKNQDPFNFSNPIDTLTNKAGEVQDQAADLVPDRINLDVDSSPFKNLTDKAGDFIKDGGGAAVAGGAAAVAGGAALFGGGQKSPQSADLEATNPELDTFDRDLDAISFEGLDDDPFAGLSDLLGEETGDISLDHQKPDSSDFFTGFKDKASDLLEDGKGLGGAALAGGAAATAGAGQAFQSFFTGKEVPTGDLNEVSGNFYSEGQITLVSPNSTQAYTHWEIPARVKRQLREQGGQKLVVRLYDVTNVNTEIEFPTKFQEFECSDSAWDLEIPISESEHRYLTEIGYLTADGRWLMLARSAPLWIRSDQA
jgi:hypothetical protein